MPPGEQAVRPGVVRFELLSDSPQPLDVNTISRDGAVTSRILVFFISGIAAICAVAVCVFIYSTVNGAPVVAAPLYAPAAKIE